MQHKKFPLQSCLEVLAAQSPRFCKQCYLNFVCVHVCAQLVLLRIRAICCVIYETSYKLKSESYGRFATPYAPPSERSAGGSLLCASQQTPLCFCAEKGRNGGQAQQYARILSPDAEHALSLRGRGGVNGAAATVCGGGGAGSWRGMACSSIEPRREHCCPRRNGSSLFSCMHMPAPLRRS